MILRPYKPHRDSVQRTRDATTAIKGILKLNISERLKRKLVSKAIWYATECDGKYNLRYVSEGAKTLTKKRQRRHEHVWTRNGLIAALLKNPRRAAEIMQSATACLVTRKEHNRLAAVAKKRPSAEGWDRYRFAKIAVFDRAAKRKKRVA